MRDTIDMAREAGFPMAWISDNDGGVIRWKDIKAFEALVRADEREACAKVCEDSPSPPDWNSVAVLWKECRNKLAAAIRARGNT
jgi:hypothetical protein